MDLRTIVVTWMDGEVATYEDATASVRDGILHIHVYSSAHGVPTGEWHFPAFNIRSWGPEKWTANHTNHSSHGLRLEYRWLLLEVRPLEARARQRIVRAVRAEGHESHAL